MIELTGKELFDSMQILPKFCSENKFPTKVAYRLSRIYKHVEKEHKTLDEQRIALVKKFGNEADQGQFKILPEKLPEFQKELEELFAEKLEIPFDPVDISLLNGIEVAPANFVVLDKFFKEQEQNE